MWRKSPERAGRGFTLIEVLVTMFSLVVIVVAAGQLLFATRRSTQRQQYQVDARQTARAAADYMNFVLRGATDMNVPSTQTGPSNPGSIMIWTWVKPWDGSNHPCPGSDCRQVTYDNLTDATLGDLGTDIVTFAQCTNPQVYNPIGNFVYGSSCTGGPAGCVTFYPTLCTGPNGNSTNALAYFEQVTGYTSTSNPSELMVIADTSGQWGFFQITDYSPSGSSNTSCCTAPSSGAGTCQNENGIPQPCLMVGTNIHVSSTINPPGLPKPTGTGIGVKLFAGVHYSTVRVCNGWLEQKDGIFDPTTDNNCTAAGTAWNQAPWTPLIPNVEDLQFAYVFNDGSIWNDGAQTLPGGTANHVPSQVGPGNTGAAQDITNAVGIRITVTARSAAQFPLEPGRFKRPPAENNPHDGSINAADLVADEFYRFQASTVAMLRGRTAGS